MPFWIFGAQSTWWLRENHIRSSPCPSRKQSTTPLRWRRWRKPRSRRACPTASGGEQGMPWHWAINVCCVRLRTRSLPCHFQASLSRPLRCWLPIILRLLNFFPSNEPKSQSYLGRCFISCSDWTSMSSMFPTSSLYSLRMHSVYPLAKRSWWWTWLDMMHFECFVCLVVACLLTSCHHVIVPSHHPFMLPDTQLPIRNIADHALNRKGGKTLWDWGAQEPQNPQNHRVDIVVHHSQLETCRFANAQHNFHVCPSGKGEKSSQHLLLDRRFYLGELFSGYTPED